jgi:hypothetical protein
VVDERGDDPSLQVRPGAIRDHFAAVGFQRGHDHLRGRRLPVGAGDDDHALADGGGESLHGAWGEAPDDQARNR